MKIQIIIKNNNNFISYFSCVTLCVFLYYFHHQIMNLIYTRSAHLASRTYYVYLSYFLYIVLLFFISKYIPITSFLLSCLLWYIVFNEI